MTATPQSIAAIIGGLFGLACITWGLFFRLAHERWAAKRHARRVQWAMIQSVQKGVK